MKRFGFTRKTTSSNIHDDIQAEGSSSGDGDENKAQIEMGNVKGASTGVETTEVGMETEAQAERRLSAFKKEHFWDPNLGNDVFDEIDDAVNTNDGGLERRLVGDVLENSPYPEVRAAVRNYDVDLPCSTIRSWTIGLILTTVAAGLNSLFNLREPSIVITSIVCQLVAYPIAQIWDVVMPDHQFNVGGFKFNFRPGPFNMKEHTIIVVMANANFGGGAGYFLDVFTALEGFYLKPVGWGFGLLVAWSTQISGFGIAGMLRPLLVEPAIMMWPSQLVNCAFMYALHDHSATDPTKAHGWTISRYKWFLYVFLGSFCWYWVPGYIAPFLSTFAFVTFIRPNDVIINQLFGAWTGLSLIPLTFDWTQISAYIYSPLISPWHATANTLISMVIFIWIVTPAIHYSNIFYGNYLPISDSNAYDNTGQLYDTNSIVTPDLRLNTTAYYNYSPLYLSTTFSLGYGLSFASLTSVLVHVGLFHGRELYNRLRSARGDLDDVHTKLMRHYKAVPFWWYAALFIAMVAFGFAGIYAYDTGLTWWALILSFIIALFFTIPIGVVQALTNIQLGLNVITEFIIGYALPGRPLAMMLFKTWGYISMAQALYFIQDLKLGHYLKVPPRPMFLAQVIATIWGSLVELAVFKWAFANIPNICSQIAADNPFSCPGGRVFFNASVIWGLIGPKRIFSPGHQYASLNWFWLVGALLPIAIYFGARAFPRSPIRFLNAPVIFGGIGNIPPATPLNYLSWGLVGFIFNKWIRNRFRGWWMRFNYVTSAGMDSGLFISTIVIVLALSLTNTNFPAWWGSTVPYSTMDFLDTAIQKPLPTDGSQHFGPGPGQF